MTEDAVTITPVVLCRCGHPARDHERSYGSHRSVCMGARREGAVDCSCDACVDHRAARSRGEGAPDFCACRRFVAARAGAST